MLVILRPLLGHRHFKISLLNHTHTHTHTHTALDFDTGVPQRDYIDQ